MNKKELFYKAIIWQIIGLSWISILSYIWFDLGSDQHLLVW